MKKSELRKLIRETIREQMGGPYYGYPGWTSPVGDQGQIIAKFIAPPLGANCYACVSNGLTGEYGIENVLMTVPSSEFEPYGFEEFDPETGTGWLGGGLIEGDVFCGPHYLTWPEMFPESEYSSAFEAAEYGNFDLNTYWDIEPIHLFYTSIEAMEFWSGDRCSGTRPIVKPDKPGRSPKNPGLTTAT